MDDHVGRMLLRLSLHDEQAVAELVTARTSAPGRVVLDPSTRTMVQVAALVCLDADTCTFQVHVERALAAGVDADDMLEVLAVLAPLVGSARIAAGAASLARALGYDLDGALERHDVAASTEVPAQARWSWQFQSPAEMTPPTR